jgi:hypothetical protein
MTDSTPFPFDNFTYCLTLFSKFFSSFPHGTCSLSVSCLYLALGGIYLPFRAAFPNNPTRRKHLTWLTFQGFTGLSPSAAPYSKGLEPRLQPKVLLETTIRQGLCAQGDFKFELFPLHSQLLGESLLFSFPPLIDMLKFSG